MKSIREPDLRRMLVGLQPTPWSCPSGLSLDAGITLAVDDRPAGEALHVHTCLPVGCIVSLSFDLAMLTALRAGTTLKVRARRRRGQHRGRAPDLPAGSLAPALNRLSALAK